MFWIFISLAVIAAIAVIFVVVEHLFLRRPAQQESDPAPAPGSKGTIDSTGNPYADEGLRRMGWHIRR